MNVLLRFLSCFVVVGAFVADVFSGAGPVQAASNDASPLYIEPIAQTDQLVQLASQDRTTAYLPPLTEDPRLTTVAAQRAQYLIATDFFSHCTNGENDPSCPGSGLDFLPRLQQQGIDLSRLQTTAEENLALNNFFATAPASAVQQTNAAWMQDAEHRANILNPNVSLVGVAAICCWVGDIQGTMVRASDRATVFVEEFAGGPGARAVTARTDSRIVASAHLW